MILTIAISGYRSLREIVLPLERLTIITGGNGTGKSSLYRSIRLLGDVAQGRVIPALAGEGGLQSTLWAGPETISRSMKTGEHPIQGTVRRGPARLRLGLAAQDYGYAIDLGQPVLQGRTMFGRDPEIKAEALWFGEVLKRKNVIARRTGPNVQVMRKDGGMESLIRDLPAYDSMVTHAADPANAAELLIQRERMRGWRFYDQLRTDAESPARRAQVGTRAVSLASDGSNLAAAIQTIREIGDHEALDAAIDDAFPGASIQILENDGFFEIAMAQKGLLRPLKARELSDGTLRYLLLVAALLTSRPPTLMVLNEPETSLHPGLLLPLARLIEKASQDTQIIIVSHAQELVRALQAARDGVAYELTKPFGETIVEGAPKPAWEWPAR